MSSLITLGGILLLLAFGFWWAVNTGKRLNQAEVLKERVDKVANVNEFNRREDEGLNRQIQNAGDHPNPVRALCGISGKELLPIHARPILPKALLEPERTFQVCGDDYFCISPEDLDGLRIYILSMQSLVNKYEHATKVLND